MVKKQPTIATNTTNLLEKFFKFLLALLFLQVLPLFCSYYILIEIFFQTSIIFLLGANRFPEAYYSLFLKLHATATSC